MGTWTRPFNGRIHVPNKWPRAHVAIIVAADCSTPSWPAPPNKWPYPFLLLSPPWSAAPIHHLNQPPHTSRTAPSRPALIKCSSAVAPRCTPHLPSWSTATRLLPRHAPYLDLLTFDFWWWNMIHGFKHKYCSKLILDELVSAGWFKSYGLNHFFWKCLNEDKVLS